MAKQPHHRGPFDRLSRQLRRAAYANPETVCWRCGYTLHAGPHHRPDDRWEAGHRPDGSLAPEARTCNRRAAAHQTNAKKARAKTHTSSRWP